MTAAIPERWTSRDLPVLRHVVAEIDAGRAPVRSDATAKALGLSEEDVMGAFQNLYRGGYVSGANNEATISFFAFDITERALRETGAWPNAEQIADQLLWFLERKIEDATDSETRGRWQRIRDSISGAGRDFTIELAAAMAAKSMGA